MPTYVFKTKDELVWFVLTTALVLVTDSLATGKLPTDWSDWAVAIIIGIFRALVGKMIETGEKVQDKLD